MSPEGLRREIKFCRELLKPGMRFGVDLALPQVGGNARKTNKDYTKGKLAELIDVIIEEKAALFISAVGVPPRWVVDKLHSAGIPVMNMIGAPHHAEKALEQSVDIICAQGTEAGGHTGVVATVPLVPQCVDICRGRKNFFGMDVPVVAAGGIFDGRGLAASLLLGASGVWVGTRFVATPEAATSPLHRRNILNARSVDTLQTIVYSGRPCRVVRNDYLDKWEKQPEKIRELTSQGVVPFQKDLKAGNAPQYAWIAHTMGQAAGGIQEIIPAGEVVEAFVSEARRILETGPHLFAKL